MASFIEELNERGYHLMATEPFPKHHQTELIQLFHYFVRHTPAGQRCFDSAERDQNIGFGIRDPRTGSDAKTFLYYRNGYEELLRLHNHFLYLNRDFRRLLELIRLYRAHCHSTVNDFVLRLMAEISGISLSLAAPENDKEGSFRLIAYTGYRLDRRPERILSAEHTDTSALTLIVYESHPGLEIKNPTNGTWEVVPLPPRHALLFGGDKLSALTAGKILPLTHRVRHIEAAHTVDTTVVRLAIASFCNF